MYELVQISEKSYYINCPAKIGVYLADSENVYLIDSGNDKSAGRKVRQILDKNGWRLQGILNTHSHADHIGGNHYLQGQTGCRIYSPGIEGAFTKYPVLEPSFLYGGYPCKELRHKFLMAQDSDVLDFSDVEAYLQTLDMVEEMEADMFVPAHAEAAKDVKELVRYNRDQVHKVADRILDICQEPQNFEGILQQVFKGFGLEMNFEQYVLVGSTVRSYLSWLKDSGRLTAVFEDSMLLWKKS